MKILIATGIYPPEVGGPAEPARHGDMGDMVIVGPEIVGLGQGLRLGPRRAPPAFQQEDAKAPVGERQRGGDADRPATDHRDIGGEGAQPIEGRRLVNHIAGPRTGAAPPPHRLKSRHLRRSEPLPASGHASPADFHSRRNFTGARRRPPRRPHAAGG